MLYVDGRLDSLRQELTKLGIAKNRFRLGVLTLSAALLVYCASHIVCRKRHVIVHTSACAAA